MVLVLVVVGFALVFVVPLVVIVALLDRERRAFERRRVEALGRLGWRYMPPDPWIAELASIVFGASGKPMSMVAGEFDGRAVSVTDYEYSVNATDGQGNVSSNSQACHVVAIYLPAAMPWLRLTKESTVGRLRERDLQLESKAFNDAFRVETPDDRYASAMLHPRMMELMLANTWLDWQIAGPALISWNLGRWEGPETVARLSVLTRIADLIPPFVLRDYGHPLA